MENSLHIVEPLPAVRPKGAHRFEVFSPKLARRLTFFRRALVDEWIVLEADPTVICFCERPGYVTLDGHRHLADFWVEFFDHQELVILIEDCDEPENDRPGRRVDEAGLTIRRVAPADLAATRMWIDNWQRMLPYVVANRGLVPASLLSEIERFVRYRLGDGFAIRHEGSAPFVDCDDVDLPPQRRGQAGQADQGRLRRELIPERIVG
ncbi:hypothetical protein IAG25_35050 [Caballeronia sp. EK]|uniref:hypothetical protein n=1 Tax=Caballeronia sp. EK TaxID=2767469 RepID=UPI001655AACD|nr:hypothetical protein [Caballeronia sp. EK]MBC8642032.1 hypothetical protein [Caballeronia sp. EK]